MKCKCGHEKEEHIYNELACRTGRVICPCEKFEEENIKIIIFGKIISKDNQKMGKSRSGKFFMRPEFKRFERDVKIQAMKQWKLLPLSERLRVNIVFYFQNKVRVDLFNAPKSLCDALNGIVWLDDKQIEEGSLKLFYDKENPRAEIEVSIIGGCE